MQLEKEGEGRSGKRRNERKTVVGNKNMEKADSKREIMLRTK